MGSQDQPASSPAQIQVDHLDEAVWLIVNQASLISRSIKSNGFTTWTFADNAETRRLLDLVRTGGSSLKLLVAFARCRASEKRSINTFQCRPKTRVQR